MSNLLVILNFLLDYVNLSDVLAIITLTDLKQAFCSFKFTNYFETIHEPVIFFIFSIYNKIDASNSNNTTNPYVINDEGFLNTIILYTSSLNYLRYKILNTDMQKLGRTCSKYLTIFYRILNNINLLNQAQSKLICKFCSDNKIVDWIAEIFFILLDRQVVGNIDSCFGNKLETQLIETKILLLRSIYHTMHLTLKMKDVIPASVVSCCINTFYIQNKTSSEKLLKLVKKVDEYEKVYDPNELNRLIENVCI